MSTPREPKQVFQEARELPKAERAVFLDGACGGDAALRARVEALLAAEEEAGPFLAAPTQGARGVGERAPADRPTTLIDGFKLLEQIGEGGFGTVWMAEQQAPVRRNVALKIVKRGMDTRSVVARFEQERQAQAMMDHPNFAKVFDGGETPAGRPYFAMELVHGLPLTQFCDDRRLDTGERLRLFVQVCHAVQHAHQKGIIHRDLKPSNVLVTLHDGVPVPKVIDFGIAKAVHSPLTEKTLSTEFRQMVGTPEYMSPEQVELSGLDIDTRADIYALGVLLYELLTGTLPFDARTLEQKGVLELLRVIREDEPQKPSTRITTQGKLGTEAAKRRRTDPRRLGRLLSGDLDWIVMKALEKDRARRYVSADALAADIERHLRDEPVQASPPGTVYRLRKYVRRHRIGVGAGAAVAVALVAGLSAAAWLLDARAQRDVARRETSRANAVLGLLKTALTAAELREEEGEHYRRVRELFDASDRPQLAHLLDDSDRLQLARLLEESEVASTMHDLLGAAYLDMAVTYMGLRKWGQAADFLRGMLAAHRSDDDNSLIVSARAALIEVLRHLDGPTWEIESLVTDALESARRRYPAQSLEVADAVAQLASIHLDRNRFAEAEPLARECLQIRTQLLPGSRKHSSAMTLCGESIAGLGRFDEAEPLLREGYERMEEDPKSAHRALRSLICCYKVLGKPDEAARYRKLLDSGSAANK